ncbi:MAG TPA: UbiA family prenyltransferase, partial [Bacteroidales bacterium]|nr:UbiA family prenyltransferase [Bacteroidales bacterium]
MKYIQLIRWPNLVIIAATMLLVRYFVVWPGLSPFGADAITPVPLFLLLVLSFVLLAAAGYVINDIADTDVDSINKPNKVLVGRSISFKNAYNL